MKLEQMLLLWPSASLLLKHFHQETGSSKAFYSSSNWLGTILLHFSDSNVFGDYQACSLINCPLSIYWNLSASVLILSIDRVFPREVFEDRSYAPQCSVCWTAELCEEVPVYETASLRCQQRDLWFVGTEVAAWSSRSCRKGLAL